MSYLQCSSKAGQVDRQEVSAVGEGGEGGGLM